MAAHVADDDAQRAVGQRKEVVVIAARGHGGVGGAADVEARGPRPGAGEEFLLDLPGHAELLPRGVQRRLGGAPLDAQRDAVRGGGQGADGDVGERRAGEQRQDADQLPGHQEGVAGEGGQPLARGPFPVGDAGVVGDVVGPVGPSFQGDPPALHLAERDAAVGAVAVRDQAGTGLQLQQVGLRVERPDAGEGGTEAMDHRVGAAAKHGRQRIGLREGRADRRAERGQPEAFGPRLLRPPMFRQVGPDVGRPAAGPLLVHHRVGRDVQPAGAERRFAHFWPPEGRSRAQNVWPASRFLHEAPERHSGRLTDRSPQQGRHDAVATEDDSLEVHQADGVGDGVERRLPLAGRLPRLLLRPPGAKQRLDVGDQFQHFDGLGQVAVRPALEAFHAVLVTAGHAGQMDHGNGGGGRVGLEERTDLEAIGVGQEHVEDDEVGPLSRKSEAVGPGGGFADLKAFALKGQGVQAPVGGVVVHAQNGDRRRMGHRERVPEARNGRKPSAGRGHDSFARFGAGSPSSRLSRPRTAGGQKHHTPFSEGKHGYSTARGGVGPLIRSGFTDCNLNQRAAAPGRLEAEAGSGGRPADAASSVRVRRACRGRTPNCGGN